MRVSKLPSLKIGDLDINPPIIQGGMGVRVSMANLASAVANEGCAGIIASVGLGHFENFPGCEQVRINEQALREQIRKARRQSSGVIGVNIMVALNHYKEMVTTSIEENVDLIISGAGLPLELPKYLNGKNIKLVPIVSSARALNIICKKWKRDYNKMPDAVVVEGSMAGGHLGFHYDDVVNNKTPRLEEIVAEVIETANSFDPPIPVVPAGGIFDGEDIARYLKMGAAGVQMATRFVCTVECDVHPRFKQAYLDAKEGDITVINSPVGLPGRVINSPFVEKIKRGETVPFKCAFLCLRSCNPKTSPYCIAKVLANAAEGNLEEAFVFSGSNAWRCNEIVTVHQLIEQLTRETLEALNRD